MQTNSYDVVIVGGGAAGLSAALVLGRARRRIVVIDAGSPRNAPAAHMQGYLSRDGLPPSELLAIGRSEVKGYGVDLIDDVVVGIDPGFTVHLGDGRSLAARRILVATGVVDGIPDIPGVSERWGRDLLHCPYCHGYEVRDQPLGVIGSSPGSIQHAQIVRQWSDDVIYFAHTQEPSASESTELAARGIRVVHGAIERLVIEDDQLTGVQLATGETVPRRAVFVRPVIAPTPTTSSRRSAATSTRPGSPSSTAPDAPASRACGVRATPSTPEPRSSPPAEPAPPPPSTSTTTSCRKTSPSPSRASRRSRPLLGVARGTSTFVGHALSRNGGYSSVSGPTYAWTRRP